MGSTTRKKEKTPSKHVPAWIAENPSEEKQSNTVFEIISTRDMPIEEKRREAKKPLYLIRYE